MDKPEIGVIYTPTEWAYTSEDFKNSYPKGAEVRCIGVAGRGFEFKIKHRSIKTRVFYINLYNISFFHKFLEPKRKVLFKESIHG